MGEGVEVWDEKSVADGMVISFSLCTPFRWGRFSVDLTPSSFLPIHPLITLTSYLGRVHRQNLSKTFCSGRKIIFHAIKVQV